jgi:arylsulfatase A-like enzyme
MIRRSVAVGMLLLVSCAGRPQGNRPHIFILLIDTLRADRVGWYGGGAGVSPALDRLADRGTVFWRAYAASSWTNPSVASLFTSRFPSQHGVSTFQSVLAPEERTLAEELKGAGYATAGFSANLLINAGLGFAQGFDEYRIYYTGPVKERAHRIDAAALAWIDRQLASSPATPLFVYLHYMEAHEPLQPGSDMLRQLGRQRGWTAEHVDALERLAQTAPPLGQMDAASIALAQDLYDAEVASVDADIGRLLSELEARDLRRKSILVVCADHGEEFLDHGGVGHGHTLYDELIRVPLLISLPGQETRRDMHEDVSLVDLAPTLLDLAGVASPPNFEGQSRRSWLQASVPGRWWQGLEARFRSERAYSELAEFMVSPKRPKTQARALVVGSAKVIEHRDGRIEDYDLASDPREQKPGALPVSRRERLTAELHTIQARLRANRSPSRTQAIDAQTRERLRALGYDPGE